MGPIQACRLAAKIVTHHSPVFLDQKYPRALSRLWGGVRIDRWMFRELPLPTAFPVRRGQCRH
jgi:hypothetical protein